MKNVYLHTLACEKRELDIAKIYAYLTKNNYKIVDSPANSDIIIFVTCAFIDEVANVNLEFVKFFQRYNAELIVIGCLPTIEQKKLSKIFNGKTLDTKNLDKIDEFFPENKFKFKDIDDANLTIDDLKESFKTTRLIKQYFKKGKLLNNIYYRTKKHVLKHIFKENSHIYNILLNKKSFIIRISWGCLGNCSYCAIKKAIGTLKSKPLEICIQELEKGLKKGYRHVTIAASDTGAYGLDIDSSFPNLLEKMIEVPGNFELTIRDLSPIWFVKYFNDLDPIFKSGKLTEIDVPIQSANTRILKLMNRYSDIEKIKECMKLLRKRYPKIRLNTHVIIGFPSETEEEFRETLQFLKEIDFYGGFIYPYSLKTGTPAENINPKNSEKVIKKRMRSTKKFLRDIGYNVFHVPKSNFFIFNKE